MLYDIAQLISLYSNGYKLFRKPEYKKVVYETLEFMDRELSEPDIPVYFSSLDADSEEEEGSFYVWSWEELFVTLDSAKLKLAMDYYNVEREGNWEENKNVLYVNEKIEADEDLLDELKKDLFLLENKETTFVR